MYYEIVRVDMRPGYGQAEQSTGVKSRSLVWIEGERDRRNMAARARASYSLFEVHCYVSDLPDGYPDPAGEAVPA
jgi:hypothetical protein